MQNSHKISKREIAENKKKWYDKMSLWFVKSPWIVKLLIFMVVVQLVLQFMSEEVSPFIYFQF